MHTSSRDILVKVFRAVSGVAAMSVSMYWAGGNFCGYYLCSFVRLAGFSSLSAKAETKDCKVPAYLTRFRGFA